MVYILFVILKTVKYCFGDCFALAVLHMNPSRNLLVSLSAQF